MKKIIVLIFATITMMMACAGPIVIKAHAEGELSVSKEIISQQTNSLFNDDYAYAFCNILYYDPYSDPHEKVYAVSVNISKEAISNFTFTYENEQLIIISPDTDSIPLFYYVPDNNSYSQGSRYCNRVVFDFNTNHLSAYYLNGSDVDIYGLVTDFYNFDTNIEEYNNSSLDLSVTFKPVLSGAISRAQIIDGKEYTSTTLDMYVTNNGNDAQFAWFILPKGGSLSFPSLAEYNSQGFIGNPVFAYVSQEWTDYTEGFNGSAVLAPSSWHAIPSGYINQLYSVSWSQMMLSPNTEYDCVVYACLNVNPINTTEDPNSSWEVRRIDTVTCALNDVQEVYRSTFSISDPAEFNSSYVDEANQSYPWNPNADNSSLFNISNAYTDDTGNIVIRGQTRGGADTSSWSAWGDVSNNNMNNIFRSYFSFLNGAMNCFPKAFLQLLTLGLSGLIVLGIIKVVIK